MEVLNSKKIKQWINEIKNVGLIYTTKDGTEIEFPKELLKVFDDIIKQAFMLLVSKYLEKKLFNHDAKLRAKWCEELMNLANKRIIIKEFKDEFYSAYTLNPDVIGKHNNGWEIKAKIQEDYYKWVNYFEAKKGKMWVKGDFEDKIYASSEKAYKDFRKYFNPESWDYGDI